MIQKQAGHTTHLVKHFKEFSTRLMNGADDCSATECKRLEQWHTLKAWCTVQTTVNRSQPNHCTQHVTLQQKSQKHYSTHALLWTG